MEYKTIQCAKLYSGRLLKCAVVRGKVRMDDGLNTNYELLNQADRLSRKSCLPLTSQEAILIPLYNLTGEMSHVNGHKQISIKSDSERWK